MRSCFRRMAFMQSSIMDDEGKTLLYITEPSKVSASMARSKNTEKRIK